MKKVIKLITLVIMSALVITSIQTVNAASQIKFGTNFIDYDISENDYMDRGTNILNLDEGIEPGKLFQIDLMANDVGDKNITSLNLYLNFDENIIEPVYEFDEFNPAGITEPYRMDDNDFFPSDRRGTQWRKSSSFNNATNGIVELLFSDDTPTKLAPLEDKDEKRMISIFFKVKEDAAPGSIVKLEYGVDNRGEGSNYSVKTGPDSSHAIIFEEKDIGVIAETFVKGPETPPENTKIDHISLTGNTGKGSYDYLKDGDIKFNEAATEPFEIVVPNSVSSLKFDKILGGDNNTANVNFGKQKLDSEEEESITDNGLDVGLNKYMATVRDSTETVVKKYIFEIHRLDNHSEFNVNYTVDSNVGTFGSNKSIELPNGVNSVKIEAQPKPKLDENEKISPDYDYKITKENGSSYEGSASTGYTVPTLEPVNKFSVVFIPEEAKETYDNVPGINDNRANPVTVTDYSMTKASNDTSIKKVTVKDSNSSSTFNATTTDNTNYNVLIPTNVDNVDLSIELNDSGAKIMTSGLTGISVPSVKDVVVNAADGISKTYKFTFTKESRTDASLKSLSIKVNDEEKNPNVDSPTKDTVIELDFANNYNAVIQAIANDNGGSIVSGNETRALIVGDNIFEVKVKAENGSIETYNINIKVKMNHDLDIKDDGEDWLVDPEDPIIDESNPGETDPANNDIEVYRYSLNVKYSKDKFNLNDLKYEIPKPENEWHVVAEPLEIDLQVGPNNEFIFQILTLDNQRGAKYIISINRAENDDSKLGEDLGVVGGDDWLKDPSKPIEDTSNNNETDVIDDSIKIYRYKINVKYWLDNFEFKKENLSIVLPEGGVYTSISDDPLSLNVGSNNEFIFEIKSQDGSSTSRYIIEINREENQDTRLEGLDVNDAEDWLLNPSDSNPLKDKSKPGGETVENDDSIEIFRYDVHVKNSKTTFGIKNYDNNGFADSDLSFKVKPGMKINILTDNPIYLNEGPNNRFIFEQVNSDKSSTSRYIITVVREEKLPPAMPKLSKVMIDDVEVSNLEFDPNINVTTINLDNYLSENQESFEFKVSAQAGFIAAPQVQTVVLGNESEISRSIVVSDAEGLVNVYLFKFTRTLSSDSELGDIEIDYPSVEDPDSGAVDGNTTTYKHTITVPYAKEKFYREDLQFEVPLGASIDIETDSPLALTVGSNNKYIFTITSEDGSSISKYIYTIIRLPEDDNNPDKDKGESDLDGGVQLPPINDNNDNNWVVDPENPIEGDDKEETPGDPNLTVYKHTIRVKYEKTRFYLDDLYLKVPDGATLKLVDGTVSPIQLSTGENGNMFIFEVTSGNKKNISRYELKIIREKEDLDLENDESKLENIEVDKDQDWTIKDSDQLEDNSIADEKDPSDENISIYRYYLEVANEKDRLYSNDLDLTLPKNSTIKYISNNPLKLNVGSNNEFIFEVTSESGKFKSRYIITIDRARDEELDKSEIEDGITPNPGDNEEDWITDPSVPLPEDPDSGKEETDSEGVVTKTVKHTITVKYEKNRFYRDDLNFKVPNNATLEMISKNPLNLSVGEDNLFSFKITSGSKEFITIYEIKIIRLDEEVIEDPNDNNSKLEDGIIINPGNKPSDWETDTTKPLPEEEGSDEIVEVDPEKRVYKHKIVVKYEKDSFYRDDIKFEIPKNATYKQISDNPLALVVGSASENTFIFEITSANGKFISRYEIAIERQSEIINDGSDESDLIGDLELDKDQDFTEDSEDLVNESIDDELLGDIKIYRYSLNVINSKTRFYLSDLTYKLPEKASVVMISNNPLALNVGPNNEFVFQVVSESGETISRYIISINREALIEVEKPYLINVSIDGNEYIGFDQYVNIHTIDLDSVLNGNYTEFVFEVTPSEGATATKTTETISVSGSNEIERAVTVTDDAGEINIYVFRFKRTLGTDNGLDNIIVDKGTLTPTFDENQTTYEVEVDGLVDIINVEAISKDKNAKIVGDGAISLKPGKNNVTIIVTPENNGTPKEYNVIVIRPLKLVELKLDDEIIELSSGVTVGDTITYDIGEITSDKINTFVYAVANHSSVTFEGNVNKVVSLDGDSIKFKLINEDGSESLNVVINYQRDQTGIDNITVTDGDKTWSAEKDQSGDYTITVDKDTDISAIEDTIKVELEFDEGKVSISNPTINPDGSHDYVITVEDKNGKSHDYNLKIENSEDNDEDENADNNYLKFIAYNDNQIVDFVKTETEYSINIGANEELVITAEAEDENANVIIGPEKDSKVEIIVISKSGSIRKYTVNVVREDLSSTSLEDLKVLEANLTPVFKPNLTNYYLSIPNELESITVEYTTSDGVKGVNVESNDDLDIEKLDETQHRVKNIPIGESIISINVEANSGTIYTYYIHVTRSSEANNLLDDLFVLDQVDDTIEYKLSPEFDSQKLAYTVTVPNEINNFTVDAVINPLANEITAGLGDINISPQAYPYIHEVRVVDKQNVVRIYTITFIKAPSEDARLANITTDKGPLSPVFEADKTTYSIDVPYESVDINLLVTKISQDQIVEGDGKKSLSVGINTFEIKVTSGSATMTYTIHVNREGGALLLDWLTVSEGELTPEFDRNIIQYRVAVPYETESIDIDGGAANPDHQVTGIGTFDLDVGINIFKILVKASETDFKAYYVVVDRAYENEEDNPYKDDLSLIFLSLGSEELNEEFDPKLFTYTSNFKNKYPSGVDLVAIAINPEAKVEIDGNNNLVDATNTIKINVSLADASQETTITIMNEDLRLMSDIHEIGELYIATVKTQQSVLDLKDQMLNPNDQLQVFKNGKLMEDNEKVGTGTIIKLIVDGKEYDAKTIVVLGDINGDGDIRINDFMSVQNHLLGTALIDHQFIAADVNRDGSVRINDFMLIQSHLLKISDIHGE